MNTIHFKQIVIFKTSPEEIYNALMDSKKHSLFTGGKAVIGKKVGDTYSAYDDYISGKNIELIPGKKILQTWKATDDGWPEGHYSTIEFVFKKTKEGTELQFTHTNIPTTVKANYAQGWDDYYWEPMKAMVEK